GRTQSLRGGTLFRDRFDYGNSSTLTRRVGHSRHGLAPDLIAAPDGAGRIVLGVQRFASTKTALR
ncbi:MAG TPA: hypothetical protein VKT26_07015, partial [Acetobacteraceae bacterium]|nr:hypothetical protein [Acetobacteraceae bacterium]